MFTCSVPPNKHFREYCIGNHESLKREQNDGKLPNSFTNINVKLSQCMRAPCIYSETTNANPFITNVRFVRQTCNLLRHRQLQLR